MPEGEADVNGTVRMIMVLGHYVEVHVQCGEAVVKCFLDREVSDRLDLGDKIGLKFEKYHMF